MRISFTCMQDLVIVLLPVWINYNIVGRAFENGWRVCSEFTGPCKTLGFSWKQIFGDQQGLETLQYSKPDWHIMLDPNLSNSTRAAQSNHSSATESSKYMSEKPDMKKKKKTDTYKS